VLRGGGPADPRRRANARRARELQVAAGLGRGRSWHVLRRAAATLACPGGQDTGTGPGGQWGATPRDPAVTPAAVMRSGGAPPPRRIRAAFRPVPVFLRRRATSCAAGTEPSRERFREGEATRGATWHWLVAACGACPSYGPRAPGSWQSIYYSVTARPDHTCASAYGAAQADSPGHSRAQNAHAFRSKGVKI